MIEFVCEHTFLGVEAVYFIGVILGVFLGWAIYHD